MKRLNPITNEEWLKCNKYNRDLLDEFLINSPQLSPHTKDAYKSNLMIWFRWVYDNLNDKAQYDIKPIEYMRYQNWLINMEHSSSDINNKRAAISSLNNYLVLFYQEEYPTFRNFIVRGMPRPEKHEVNEKLPPTKDEFNKLVAEMESREDWQKVAYLKYTFDTGCRRAESVQLLKEIILYEPVVKTKEIINQDGVKETKIIKYYQSNPTRCKGRGKTGKVRRLIFSQDTMDAIIKWLEVRGEDDCPYVFVSKNKSNVKQLSPTTINRWCSNVFTPILGRRFHPHILREAKATISVVEDGKSVESVQKLLGHESSETTQIYIINNDNEDYIDELFYVD